MSQPGNSGRVWLPGRGLVEELSWETGVAVARTLAGRAHVPSDLVDRWVEDALVRAGWPPLVEVSALPAAAEAAIDSLWIALAAELRRTGCPFDLGSRRAH